MNLLFLYSLFMLIRSLASNYNKFSNDLYVSSECKVKLEDIAGLEETKEEVMECKDGYDGPNYWELFAQFYYSGLSVPPYCRQYARPNHPFKTPGMICLSEDGDWEKQ